MTADNFFIHAKKTFKDEISSINYSLSNLSKKDFNLICDRIKNLKGKLVLMGVGKSGHIAAKIHLLYRVLVRPLFLSIHQKLVMVILELFQRVMEF